MPRLFPEALDTANSTEWVLDCRWQTDTMIVSMINDV